MREQKKCKRTNENAVTLIALIISIIVMLILAGVSINAIVGDNGIITQAINAKTLTELASEKEEIQYIVIEGYSGETTTGTALYDKNLSNNRIWNIVVINDTQEVYGTGWYYIEAGTDIGDYGKTKYGWLVNYETGEIVQLEEDNYTQLDYTSSLAVTDNIILNIDSGIIEDSDDSLSTAEQIANVEEQLGDNITLVGFDEEDWGEASGITSTSFNFDGVDDYIQIQYDSEEEKEALAENGFTFEFYGIYNGGTSYDSSGETYNGANKGLLCWFNGNDNANYVPMRFCIRNDTNIVWNCGIYINGGFTSDFMVNSTYPYNLMYANTVNKNSVFYITITLDCSSECEEGYYKQSCYLNGEIVYSGNYDVNNWSQFVKDYYDMLTYFNFGRCQYDNVGCWHYSELNAYVVRLYSGALTDDEVLENYNTSVAYHTLLENMNGNTE